MNSRHFNRLHCMRFPACPGRSAPFRGDFALFPLQLARDFLPKDLSERVMSRFSSLSVLSRLPPFAFLTVVFIGSPSSFSIYDRRFHAIALSASNATHPH